ncbi:hypothetical protein AGMMS49965_20180 [Bacteroidia bacterium]|nr:hypothetical protein AGMMS49965_20180 [Bacteroidia bacterium]
MKKTFILLLALCCVSAAFGQESKQKVAIYTDDKSGKNYAEFAGEFLTNAIVKRGAYDAFERTDAFLNLIGKEQGYQRSGAVDDSKIAKLGAQLGVQLVCAVKIGLMDGQPFISAKLIDVETAGIKGTARPKIFSVGDFEGFEAACDAITASMFGERGSGSRSNTSSAGSTGGKTNGAAYNPDGIELICVEGTGGALGTPSFYIGKYEVTQAQYQKVMNTNPSSNKGPNYPVETVSWNDAQEFVNKLNALTGRHYRLPTESEWVYAANGGLKNDTYEYAGSNSIDAVAWYIDNSGWYSGSSATHTHAVGTKSPNSIGIYDMSGNVWEWCQDWYTEGSYRVNRGGSWSNSAPGCRVSHRYNSAPGGRDDGLGFRVVLPL